MKEEEWFDKDNPDSDSPMTELVEGSHRSEDLFALILGDPNHQRFGQFSRNQEIGILVIGGSVLLKAAILIAAALGLLTEGLVNLAALIGSIFGGIFILCSFACLRLEKHLNGLFVNNRGVAWKSLKFGNEAIEWEHVTHIGIRLKKEEISGVNIYGNRRKILYHNPILGFRFTFEVLRNYIPDLHEWKASRDKDWLHQYARYHRKK